MKIDNRETELKVYKEFRKGRSIADIAREYETAKIDIANIVYKHEHRDETAIAERYLECKKMRDIDSITKKNIDAAILNGDNLDDIAEIYDIRYDSLEDYYIEKYYKPLATLEKMDELKRRYFAGESIQKLKADTGIFGPEIAAILDKQAIYEDFRAGMTLPELVEVYGRNNIEDIAFMESGVKVDIGRRYGESEILKIIVSKIAKGE